MRFNTPQELKEWAARAAYGDHRRHIENNVELNPYCTNGARNSWQRGFDGAPAYTWENLDWDTHYQRGAAAAKISGETYDHN